MDKQNVEYTYNGILFCDKKARHMPQTQKDVVLFCLCWLSRINEFIQS